jgi:hypothetical protein
LPQPFGGIALAATIGLVATFIFPCRIPGWNFAAREAVNLVPVTRLQVESMQDAPAGVLFVDNAAVPWFIDRPVVWAPIQPETRRRICEFLGQPEVTP